MDQKISRKLNILEIHSSLGNGGGQRNMVTFCKYLRKDIFNVYAAGYGIGGAQENKLRGLGIEYVVGDGKSQKIIDFIQENKIDIIHFHRSGHYVLIETEIIDGAKKVNPKIIIIEKNVFGKFDKVSGKDIACSMFQSMMHLNGRFLPASGQKFDFSKMNVLYNMVDGEEFEKYKLTVEDVLRERAELKIAPDDFVIGKIARPHIAKWSDLILDMMPYLVRLVPNIKFIIMGVPESRKKIISRSWLKEYFIIMDETDDEKKIHSFYQIIDVLAHSSKIGECNGNTINEAMYWKKPVVVNSTPKKDNGQLEQVIHMMNGIIANSPQTYARALAYLFDMADERKTMGENAFIKVKNDNNPQKITAQLESIIMSKLGKNSSSDFIFNPTSGDIVGYREEYRNRLKWEFGQLSWTERLINCLIFPKKIFTKISDFLEDKFSFSLYG